MNNTERQSGIFAAFNSARSAAFGLFQVKTPMLYDWFLYRSENTK